MGDLINGNTTKIRVEQGWGQEHKKTAISPERCKIGPRLQWRTNIKSIRAFDWCQNQWPWMTLNSRNVTLAEVKKLCSPPEKIHIISGKMKADDSSFYKYRPLKYMRIFAGCLGEGCQLSNDNNGHAVRPLLLTWTLCFLLIYGVNMSHGDSRCIDYWLLSSFDRTLLRKFEGKTKRAIL